MDFLEKNLEDIIFNAAQTEEGRSQLQERGLDLHGLTLRQVCIGDGIADLINISTDGRKGSRILRVSVIELKKEELNINTLTQSIRYFHAINDIIRRVKSHCKGENPTWHCVAPSIILIGKSITADLQMLLPVISPIEVYTYSYTMDGISFNYVTPDYNNSRCVPQKLLERVCSPSINDIRNILRP